MNHNDATAHDPTLPWKSGLLLAFIALLGVGLLVMVNALTRDEIASQERRVIAERLAQVLDPGRYDNDLIADVVTVTAPGALEHFQPVRVYRARLQGEPAALIMEVIATEGYNGNIVLLMGVDTQGVVTGVRVLQHRETPGLGDPIERRRSDWITSFTGTSLGQPPREQWAVTRDGGVFDQFTGATITPRAVVGAIARALAWQEQQGDRLYTLKPDQNNDDQP